MNKRILISLSVIGAVAAIAIGGTIAYFSDTETSQGNTFTAGSIDLKIDNDAWFNGVPQPQLSWTLSDLTGQLFFNYTDLKPGDLEEDTVSIHVDNNPSWVCANLTLTKNDDMTCTEPELGNDPNCLTTPGDTNLWDGELAQNLNFVFWADDGDNALEVGEIVLMEGPAGNLGATGITYPIVDSTYNAFGTVGQPFPGATTKYIGKAFCFGTLTKVPVAQGQGNPATNPGVTCNGAAVDNASQSDSMMGNISFTAIQSRNNSNFRCIPKPITRVDRTQPGFGDGGWAGWSCLAGTTAVGGGIDSSTNPVGPNGVAAPGAPAVGGFNYPVYPHYTFGGGETGYVVRDLPDGLGNTISFHIDCQAN